MNFILKVKHVLDKVTEWFAVAIFSLVFVVVLAQIFFRYIARSPLVWSEELSRYLFIWVCYLGWIFATRNRTHIKVDFIVNQIPLKLKRVIQILLQLASIGFMGVLFYYGYQMTMRSGETAAVALPVNFVVVYISLPISAILVLFYQVLELLELINPQLKFGNTTSKNGVIE